MKARTLGPGSEIASDRFARLVPGFGTQIVDGEVNLALGLMRFGQPGVAAEATALGGDLPPIADYVRWVMLLPPDHPRDGRTRAHRITAATHGAGGARYVSPRVRRCPPRSP
ncbi:MAG: hypothetical protein IRZ07_18685 [Microbispora sp.]|nr:hypothetical protein [Microbispora sp.]